MVLVLRSSYLHSHNRQYASTSWPGTGMGSTIWRQLLENTSKCLCVSCFYTISDRWQDSTVVSTIRNKILVKNLGPFPCMNSFFFLGPLVFTHSPKTSRFQLTANPDLPAGVNVSMHGCLLLYFSYLISAGIGSSTSMTLKDKRCN